MVFYNLCLLSKLNFFSPLCSWRLWWGYFLSWYESNPCWSFQDWTCSRPPIYSVGWFKGLFILLNM